MKKLIIHAGPHKTGTSYIQQLLLRNYSNLLDVGIVYPKQGMAYGGHHEIANYFCSQFDKKALPELVRAIQKNQQITILSSENFSKLNREGLVALREAFKEFKIEFIFYLRNPSIRLFSWWGEEIRHGFYHNFYRYSFPHFVDPFRSRILNPMHFFREIEDVFGSGKIKVVSYEHAKFTKSMLKSFWKACDLPPIVADIELQVNTRRDIAELELLRLLNILANRDERPKGPQLREAFHKYYQTHSKSQISKIISSIHEYDHELVLGDKPFDQSILNNIYSHYKDRFVNEIQFSEPKKLSIPSERWLTNINITGQLESIYLEIQNAAITKTVSQF